MVGCGALGCEFMKNFALNGICCGMQSLRNIFSKRALDFTLRRVLEWHAALLLGSGGKLFVTDADRIELSNLSRQFLFREHNVGQPKSRYRTACVSSYRPS